MTDDDTSPLSDPESLPGAPPAVTHLARERAEARAARNWARADALKAQIEAAGWLILDRGNRFTLRRAAPLDLVIGGETRYGSAATVPSRLDEPATARFTVVTLASEEPERIAALLAGLRAHAPVGTHVVVVANDPSDAQATDLAPGSAAREPIAGGEIEVVRTAARLGHAAALNAAMRRAAGEIVVLADGSAAPEGDALSPLVDALADSTVAAAGGFGLVSADRVRLRPPAVVESSAPRVMALEGAWLGFRRADYVALGPFDERFVSRGWLDVWWSLRLRAGEDPETEGDEPDAVEPDDENVDPRADDQDAPPPDGGGDEAAFNAAAWWAAVPPARLALRLDLPLARPISTWPPDRTRLNRRNAYRVLNRYGWRTDLLSGEPSRPGGSPFDDDEGRI